MEWMERRNATPGQVRGRSRPPAREAGGSMTAAGSFTRRMASCASRTTTARRRPWNEKDLGTIGCLRGSLSRVTSWRASASPSPASPSTPWRSTRARWPGRSATRTQNGGARADSQLELLPSKRPWPCGGRCRPFAADGGWSAWPRTDAARGSGRELAVEPALPLEAVPVALGGERARSRPGVADGRHRPHRPLGTEVAAST